MRRSTVRPKASAFLVCAGVLAFAAACSDDSTGPNDNGPVADSVQLPDTLFDGGAFVWDIYLPGFIGNGSNDAYDAGVQLTLGGVTFQNADSVALQYPGVPEIWLGPDTVSGLQVTRRVYVSPVRRFARFLEVIENRGSATVALTAAIDINLGSDGATILVGTSDGDATFETSDRWIITDDADATGDPTLMHVIQGTGASVVPSTVAAPAGGLQYTFPLSVPAGGKVILMHYASQNSDRASANLNATALSALGYDDDLAELSAEDRAAVINWDLVP